MDKSTYPRFHLRPWVNLPVYVQGGHVQGGLLSLGIS